MYVPRYEMKKSEQMIRYQDVTKLWDRSDVAFIVYFRYIVLTKAFRPFCTRSNVS